MEYNRLGGTGHFVSAVGLGCNNLGGYIDLEQSKQVVHKALDLGINHFDVADYYPPGSGPRGRAEEFLGKCLGSKRKDISLASKFQMAMGEGPLMRGSSRRYIMNAVEASLKRLNTDYLDLYQMHWWDEDTPLDETLCALDDLVRQGKVRYIGCCNYASWQIADAQWTSKHNGYQRFVSAQAHYNLIQRDIEAEIVPACDRFNVSVLPYFPLASGLLTGKYKRGKAPAKNTRMTWLAVIGDMELTEGNFDKVEALEAFGVERGFSLLELAMGWLNAQPHVPCIIAGATKPTQVAQNVKAAQIKLTADDLAALDAITKTGSLSAADEAASRRDNATASYDADAEAKKG